MFYLAVKAHALHKTKGEVQNPEGLEELGNAKLLEKGQDTTRLRPHESDEKKFFTTEKKNTCHVCLFPLHDNTRTWLHERSEIKQGG